MQNYSSYSLSELKSYCSDNGIHVTGDKRRKDSYISSIKQHQRHNQTSELTEATPIVKTAPTTAPISYFVDTEEHLPVQRVDYFINLEESAKEAPALTNSVAIPALVLLLPILCLLISLELVLRATKQAIPAIRRTVAAIPKLNTPALPWQIRESSPKPA